jgi:hypothetical protein
VVQSALIVASIIAGRATSMGIPSMGIPSMGIPSMGSLKQRLFLQLFGCLAAALLGLLGLNENCKNRLSSTSETDLQHQVFKIGHHKGF